jgi:hypothetical protein
MVKYLKLNTLSYYRSTLVFHGIKFAILVCQKFLMNEDGNQARRHISCHEKPKLNDNTRCSSLSKSSFPRSAWECIHDALRPVFCRSET